MARLSSDERLGLSVAARLIGSAWLDGSKMARVKTTRLLPRGACLRVVNSVRISEGECGSPLAPIELIFAPKSSD